MNCKKYLFVLIALTLISPAVWAQNSLSVSDRSSVTLDLSALIAAGKNTEMVADNSQWINYSLNINPAEPFASISVAIASGDIPSGVELYMQAGYYTGQGRGKAGRPTGKVRVDHVPKVLLNDIGTSYTGQGKRQGHQLTLSMVITDFSLLQPGDYTLYIQYTLKQ
jgi:hypothetical protein